MDAVAALNTYAPQAKQAPRVPQDANLQRIDKVAKEFESFFIYHFLQAIEPEIDQDSPFHGGFAEDTFRQFLNEHVAEIITERGGFGIADTVRAELLKQQEASR